MLPAYASPANPVDMTPVWSRFAELYPALVDVLARSGEVDAVVPVLAAARGDGRGRPRRACATSCGRCAPTAVAGAGVRLLGGAAPGPPAGRPARRGQAAGVRLAVAHRAGGRASLGATPWRGSGCARPRPSPSGAPVRCPLSVTRSASPQLLARVRGGDRRAPPCAAPRMRPPRLRTAFPAVVKIAAARAPHRAGTACGWGSPDAAAVRGGRRRAARRCRRGAGAAPAGGSRGGRRRVPRPVVRADGDGRARRHLGRGARRRRVRSSPRCPATRPASCCARCADTRCSPAAARRPPVDLAALARIVVAVGDLLAAPPEVAGLDLNPVLATADGAVAVDWKIQLGEPGHGLPGRGSDDLSSAAHDDSAAGSP